MGLYSLERSISGTSNHLVVRNAGLARILTLFVWLRRTDIYMDEGRLRFRTRALWIWPREQGVPLSDVWYIDYTHRAQARGRAENSGARYQTDVYTLSVVTRSEQRHIVCTFRGRSYERLPALYAWIRSYLWGEQERQSQDFAEELSGLLQVPIGRPWQVDMATCPACGHPTSARSGRCLYCGAYVPESSSRMAFPR